MSGPRGPTHRGRRGRRTAGMIRIARERVHDLFGLAAGEGHRGSAMSDRYVQLARRIGMRYNVRLPPELRELYCRGCSSYLVEGRTVRTRLRSGRRVRTCLGCGRTRRVPLAPRSFRATTMTGMDQPASDAGEGMVEEEGSSVSDFDSDGEEEG